jgi:diacylglycerol kinase
MASNNHPFRRGWGAKFANAFRGITVSIRTESSFRVHLPCAVAVVACGIYFQVERWEWCVLVLCVGTVLAAEMFNSALESLAKTIADRPDPHVGDALDIASGAVLVAAIAAAIVGLAILVPHCWR